MSILFNNNNNTLDFTVHLLCFYAFYSLYCFMYVYTGAIDTCFIKGKFDLTSV